MTIAMQDYKINYTDGTTQTFPTVGPRLHENWLVFEDGAGEQLRVRAEEVESIIRVGTPERTGQTPKAA